MKYNEKNVEKFCNALKEGTGRVRACKAVKIHYCTFIEWMEKPEFAKLVEKAESTGNDLIKDLCKRKIIEDKSWQSGAWWLERNYPEEFKLKSELGGDLNVTTTIPEIKFVKSNE